MRLRDVGAMAGLAITGHPLRSLMLLIAVAIGVAAVLVLTSLGEGARRYVTGEFNALAPASCLSCPDATVSAASAGWPARSAARRGR